METKADRRMVSRLGHKMFMHEAAILRNMGCKEDEMWNETREMCYEDAEKYLKRPDVVCLSRIQQPLRAYSLWLKGE